ncbi:MAG: hypothetical protein ACO3BX_05895 [Candidatus Limnocylindrus sp.]
MTPLSSPRIRKYLSKVVAKLYDEGRIDIAEEATDGLYTVYMLEIDPEVWDCRKCTKNLGEEWSGKRAFYVGITNKTREERIAEHESTHLERELGRSLTGTKRSPYTRGAKMTRDHSFQPAEELEPLAPDGLLLDGRLSRDDAKLLEQIVIPTALRALDFAAYAGAPERFEVS